MSTVASRTFRSTPRRDSMDTWLAIIELLTRGESAEAKAILLAVKGIAASVIADQAPNNVPIVATCDGPRTRVYCVYDDDAIDGTGENEAPLGYDPLKGDWALSLPCQDSDLPWVQTALKAHGDRITARSINDKVVETAKSSNAALVFDPKGFLGS